MSFVSTFLRKDEGRNFVERNKAHIYFYYNILILLLLGLIPLGYWGLGLSPEVTLRGSLGALAIAILVIISMVLLRAGRL